MSSFAALRRVRHVILRCLEKGPACHPERSEGSLRPSRQTQSSREDACPERSEGMTAWGYVILSAAKDLWGAFLRPATLPHVALWTSGESPVTFTCGTPPLACILHL